MKLREYQRHAMDGNDMYPGIFPLWDQGKRSPLLVMPTGLGKTIVFAAVIRRRFPRRALILAHRQELIYQAKEKTHLVTGLSVDIEMGDHRAQEVAGDMFKRNKAPVVVSTIQTLTAGGDGGGRIGKFDPMEFGTVVIDEGHHSVSDSYRRVIDYFSINPDIKFLGVTATPKRGDEKAMGKVFDSVAFDYEMQDAIDDGWLVPIDQQFVSIESIDFRNVRTTAGDLNGADLDAVMSVEKNLHGVASSTVEILGDRRGIGFASSVNHAAVLANIMNRHQIGMASFVSGATDKVERKQIISDFACGKIRFLWNCGVFTEGFDDSGIGLIAMARPTKSLALYTQMMGRGTRPHESIAHALNNFTVSALRRGMVAKSCKPNCTVIDFVGNSGKHKLVNSSDILGGDYSEEARRNAVQFAMKFGKPVRIARQVQIEEEEIQKAKDKRDAEEARKAKIVAKVTFKSQRVDPFDLLKIKPDAPTRYDDKKAFSTAQRSVLKGAGYNPDNLSYGRGRQIIGIIFDRREKNKCSIGQAEVLERFHLDTDMTRDQASACLDAICKNRWRGLPKGFTIPKPFQRSEDMPLESKVDTTQFVNDDVPF